MTYLSVDKSSDIPLYIQIRDRISQAIDQGTLKAGDRLPAVSALARDIGVTQATVRRALQDLTDAGQACCHVGRGTFIQEAKASQDEFVDGAPAETKRPAPSKRTSPPGEGQNPFEFAARRLRMGVSKALTDIMTLANKPGMLHLTKGVPDPSLIPANFLEEVSAGIFAAGSQSLIEATDSLGMYQLRAEIATRSSIDGLSISPDQVLITNGSLQALTLIAQASLEDNRQVYFETPCFTGVINTFITMGHWPETISRDHQGPLVDTLIEKSGEKAAILYLCPYAQNPMGTDLSSARSRQLVDWAKRTGSTIIADEIFKDLHFSQSQAQPSLLQSLGAEQTIVVSSLSKSVMTGLRLGWLISSPKKVQQLAQLKRLMDHSCPTIIQAMALEIFRSGKFAAHTERMRVIYEERMKIMTDLLHRLMPKEVSWTRPDGGFSMLLELPRGYSSVALFLAAISKGVAFAPGPLFDIDQRFVHCLRLSCAWADGDQLKEGIELLADTLHDFLSRPAGESGLSGLGSYQ